jgi:hypothetical protein
MAERLSRAFFEMERQKAEVAPEIIGAFEGFNSGIALTSDIVGYYFSRSDSRRTSFSKIGGDLWIIDHGGERVLHVLAPEQRVKEVEIKMGSYHRGTNMPWQEFATKNPGSEFVDYMNRLPVLKESGGPIGFTYRQWQSEDKLMHATIVYAEDSSASLEPKPFFEFKE